MRPYILSSPSFDQNLGFSQGLKHFTVEQFRSGHSVKIHHLSIFLWTAWPDEELPDTNQYKT